MIALHRKDGAFSAFIPSSALVGNVLSTGFYSILSIVGAERHLSDGMSGMAAISICAGYFVAGLLFVLNWRSLRADGSEGPECAAPTYGAKLKVFLAYLVLLFFLMACSVHIPWLCLVLVIVISLSRVNGRGGQ